MINKEVLNDNGDYANKSLNLKTRMTNFGGRPTRHRYIVKCRFTCMEIKGLKGSSLSLLEKIKGKNDSFPLSLCLY